MINKIITKFNRYLIFFKWYFWLFFKVSGRIKLRGDLNGLHIEKNFYCDGDFWVGIYNPKGIISIGEGFSASGPLIITAINEIKIGYGVLLGPNVLITDHFHGDTSCESIFDIPPSKRILHTRGAIIIEDLVQIGANSVILSKCCIGRESIIGANSIVFGILESRKIYAGAPIKLL